MAAPATATTLEASEALHLIESILPLASIQGKDILDAGCGVGEYSAAFVSAGARCVTGFDISLNSLRRAYSNPTAAVGALREAPSGSQSRTAHFAQASLTDMPFPDASFDVIWSWGVLHYVHDAQPALREISRVLRPGGVVVIHTMRRGFWSAMERTSARVFGGAPRWVQPIVYATGETLVPLASWAMTGHRPAEQTSKTVRQKLYERLFMPGERNMFSLDEIGAGLGPSMQVSEARPPIADLLKRDMSITIVGRKGGA